MREGRMKGKNDSDRRKVRDGEQTEKGEGVREM